MANNVTMKNMNVENVISDLRQRITKPEYICLDVHCYSHFAIQIVAQEKLMHSTHLEQRLPLLYPEVPLIQTGYENEFGRYSSSFYEAENDIMILAKIQKFPEHPNHHYYLITQNMRTSELDIIEKIDYEFITETYGYLNNNSKLDILEPVPITGEICNNNIIPEGQVYKKSLAYDDYNNRRDGVNLKTAYISTAKNTEDSVIISESAAKKLTSPLIKPVTIIVNENDILLNTYGDEFNYKSFPDIGEESMDNLLTVVRREKKEESLFTHSYNRLTDFLMSDDKFIAEGKVIDIDVYCNNPETINQSVYNVQIKKYNDNKMRYMNELVLAVKEIQERNGSELPMSYELKKLLHEANRVLSGVQYINDKPFTGTIIKLTVLEENKIKVGDKLANRFGGKGVVSYILPDELMPIIENTREAVDIIFNSCTCVGRLNPGQMFETSLTFIGNRIIDYIILNILTPDEAMDLVREYIQLAGCSMDEFLEQMLDPNNSEEQKEEYLRSIVDDAGIMLSLEPISESMTIDKLARLYDEFTCAKPYNMIMPIRDSNGNIRYINSRRPLVIGTEYVYRLKQYADDKFSVTSSSATNIRNLNTRSKANKQYKSPHTRTPIRFGDMESGNLNHMGNEIVACILMMYSSSPHARRSVQDLYTNRNPFTVDIKLDNKAKNRNVEIINARLKTCGYRLEFKKVPKQLKCPVQRIRTDVVRRPLCPVRRIRTDVVMRHNPSQTVTMEIVKRYKKGEIEMKTALKILAPLVIVSAVIAYYKYEMEHLKIELK